MKVGHMFIENKYLKWYKNIIDNALKQKRIYYRRSHVNYSEYFEKHHILPKSLGGSDELANIVILTPKEHYICHLLLCYITPGKEKYKMINALIRMSYSKSAGQERYTSKSYSLVRKLSAEKNSTYLKGKQKSIAMRKKLSASRTGMKFSDEHKRNISLAVKSRNYSGARNPFYGKKHSSEYKENMENNKRGVGNKSIKGMIWITDGNTTKLINKNDLIPYGFYRGRCKVK